MTSTLTAPATDAVHDLAARARAVIPGGVNSGQRRGPQPDGLVFVGASGTTLTLADGRELLDFQSSYGATLLGHAYPEVDAAVAAASRRTDNVGYGVSREEVELSEAIVGLIDSVDKVSLANSGSEATFYALRLARTATGRMRVVKFEGAYHGWHDSVVMNTGTPAAKLGQPYPYSGGILPGVAAHTLVATWNDLSSVQALFDSYPGEIAAVIVDPILSSAGGILPEPAFLAGLRELTSRDGAVLIFDEVITGFRTSPHGYQRLLGITPDLTTFGKALANGYPIAGLGGRADLMDQLSCNPAGDAYFAGTYNGHPAMAAAALATLGVVGREPVHEHVFALGELARTSLQAMYDEIGVPAVVSGLGSIVHTWFLSGEVHDYADVALRHDADLYLRYRRKMIAAGVLETPLNLKSDKLTYSHTEQDIERLVGTTRVSVLAVLDERAREQAGA